MKHRVEVEKADWIIYVTDMGQSTHFDLVSKGRLRGTEGGGPQAGAAGRLARGANGRARCLGQPAPAPCMWVLHVVPCLRVGRTVGWLALRWLLCLPMALTPPSASPSHPTPPTHASSQVFAGAKKAGYLPASVKIDHVGFGLVLGDDGKKFRSRSGDVSAG